MKVDDNTSARLEALTPQCRIPVVFVVDHDASVREALERLVIVGGWQPKIFASGEEFVRSPRVLIPSCVILDVNLPDVSGLEVQTIIADRRELPIIFMSGYCDVPMTVKAMKAGAVEFLIKPFRDEVLLAALRCAIDLSCSVLSEEARQRAFRDRYASLTVREREVMGLVVRGRLNKQVGATLGISEATTKGYRGNVMRKMGAGSLPELVNMGTKLGLASDHESAERGINGYENMRGMLNYAVGNLVPPPGARTALYCVPETPPRRSLWSAMRKPSGAAQAAPATETSPPTPVCWKRPPIHSRLALRTSAGPIPKS
jgi:FixJ family two-component response regulator